MHAMTQEAEGEGRGGSEGHISVGQHGYVEDSLDVELTLDVEF